MRILLIGGNGQVGTELRRALKPLGELIVTTRSGESLDGQASLPCDLAILGSPHNLIDGLQPDIVVNATAYTAVDKAETEPDLAAQINATAVAEMAGVCKAIDIPLIHYSTDYVFDGQATTPYQVDAPTAPLGVYGQTKLDGEKAIRASGACHLILRTAWVYATHGHNFLRTMLRLGAERDSLRVVGDQVGSPTPAWLIADVTADILAQGLREGGTHHLVARGQTSWHGFAEAIFEEAAANGLIANAPKVESIPSSEYPAPAARPQWSVLDTTSLRDTYHLNLPDWRDALKRTFQSA
jgi:dTDP-4-dehydrorhamnose reductase